MAFLPEVGVSSSMVILLAFRRKDQLRFRLGLHVLRALTG
jgi:hypothetical protein